jgi:ribonuclease Z
VTIFFLALTDVYTSTHSILLPFFLPISHGLPFPPSTLQLQVQRTTSVRPSKITKIFLTHAHGDHTFGLPGLLCLMGQNRERSSPPVEIYGPEGLRMWLRVAIRYSCSRIVPPYRVHEIMDVPMAPEWDYSPRTRRFFYKGRGKTWTPKGLAGEDSTSWISQANMMQLEPSPLYGEIEGGRSIFPTYNHPKSYEGAPVWEVEDEDDVKVYAAPMSHGIPCLGFVVDEKPRPGRLRSELVEPIVKRNLKALKVAGFAIPMKAMAVIKDLPPGTAFTFPDGTVVAQEDAVEAPRQGRKVVICGDTTDSRSLINLGRNADILIHEATNSYLSGVDDPGSNLKAVSRDATIHGHSTPHMAGAMAKTIQAKRLIMNHFSARYKGDVSVDSLSIMMRMELQAMQAAGMNETQVAAAWDLMVLPIL